MVRDEAVAPSRRHQGSARQGSDVCTVPAEHVHVVRDIWVERDVQHRRRLRATCGRPVLWWGRILEDRAVFEASQVKRAQ
jgi:hypothetical protein